jgi:DNA-binding NtrC family response regulator
MTRVLLIDSNPSARLLLRQRLERAGHNVIEMTEGNLGLEYYRLHPTDVVITNVLQPDLSGLRTLILFKQEFPEATIIATCNDSGIGYSQYDPLKSARLFGALKTYRTPIEINALLQAIEKLSSLSPKFARRRSRHPGFQNRRKKDEIYFTRR